MAAAEDWDDVTPPLELLRGGPLGLPPLAFSTLTAPCHFPFSGGLDPWDPETMVRIADGEFHGMAITSACPSCPEVGGGITGLNTLGLTLHRSGSKGTNKMAPLEDLDIGGAWPKCTPPPGLEPGASRASDEAPRGPQSRLDPWGVDPYLEFSLPPQHTWQTFHQICNRCGREVRTLTECATTNNDCHHCMVANTLVHKPLRGSTYAAHFRIDCNEDNFENTGVDTTLLLNGYPLKVLCMACQGSGTCFVRENKIASDCVWCGQANILSYVDPWTYDPCYDPQPLMPSAALAGLNSAPSVIFRIQANLRKTKECNRCHRHLRRHYLECMRCHDPQCSTAACIAQHRQVCGGSFNRKDFWTGPTPRDAQDASGVLALVRAVT
jgi:hypothetical protein